jgi:hypothetical protein
MGTDIILTPPHHQQPSPKGYLISVSIHPTNICSTNGNTTIVSSKNYRHEKNFHKEKGMEKNRYLAQIFQMEYKKSAFCPFFCLHFYYTISHSIIFSLPTFLQYRAHTQMQSTRGEILIENE